MNTQEVELPFEGTYHQWYSCRVSKDHAWTFALMLPEQSDYAQHQKSFKGKKEKWFIRLRLEVSYVPWWYNGKLQSKINIKEPEATYLFSVPDRKQVEKNIA